MKTRDVTDLFVARSVVCLDIETAPDIDALNRILADPPDFDAPKNYKDGVKIAAYIATKRIEWAQDVEAKAGLSPMTGRVASWAFVSGDGKHEEVNTLGECSCDERTLLRSLLEVLRVKEFGQVVTFNGHAFDLPFLRMRMVKHGLEIPRILRPGRSFPVNPQGRHVDVRLVCTSGDRFGKGRQGEWANLIGAIVYGDPDTSGADVAGMVEAGKWEALAEYNLADALTLRSMWDRLRASGMV